MKKKVDRYLLETQDPGCAMANGKIEAETETRMETTLLRV
jgi:hypothetical protein